MNAKLLISCVFVLNFILFSNCFAQSHDPHRGMTVTNFLTLTPASINNGIGKVSIPFTVLGTPKEDSLLTYARENHITHLELYGVYKIFRYGNDTVNTVLPGGISLRTGLCNFINKAKNQYCITEIGAAGESQVFFDSVIINNLFGQSDTFLLDSAETSFFSSNPSLYNLLTTQYLQSDSLYFLSEQIRFYLQITRFNNFCSSHFDFLSVVNEIWNPRDSIELHTVYIPLLHHLDSIKLFYNSTHPTTPIKISAYVKAEINMPYDLVYVRLLDGFDTIAPIADRLFSVHYASNPVSQYTGWENEDNIFHDNRTSDSTDYHPYFSTETIYTNYYINNLGYWLRNPYYNNIFNAENIWYRLWRQDADVNVLLPSENAVEQGGFHYFDSKSMTDSLKDPRIFTSNSPICTNGNSGDTARFNYTGPREDSIAYTFTIRNKNNVQVHFSTGFTPSTNVFPDSLHLSAVHLDTLNSPYVCILSLSYRSGCSYSFSDTMFLNSRSFIQALTPRTFCEGSSVLLRSNNGSTYQWRKNGIQISGANSKEYWADTSGIYSCVITGGGCHLNTISNSIAVNSLFDTPIEIYINCLNDSTADLSVTPQLPIGTLYYWNTNDTTPSIITTLRDAFDYKVIVNYPSGCFESNVTSLKLPAITPHPDIVFRKGFSQYCSGQFDSLIFSPSDYILSSLYKWSYNNYDTTTVADFYITPPPLNSFTLYLQQTSPSGCDNTFNDTLLISVFNCCSAMDSTNFAIDSSSNYPAGFVSTQVNVRGDFYIVADFTIHSSTLEMDSSAHIYVLPGVTLNIENNSFIQACGTHWKGIYLADGSFLNISGSTISQADTAISAEGSAQVILHDNVLSNNFTGLSLHDGNFNTSVIEGNRFQGSLQIGQKGIRLSNVPQVSIGQISGDQNIFRALYYGIYALNSDAEILACTFDSIFRTCTPGPGSFEKACSFFSGSAVLGYSPASKNVITVGGSPAKACYFYNCRSGITLIGDVNLTASHNLFDNASYQRSETSYAIYAIESDSSERTIVENHVDNFKNGFHLYNSLSAKVRIFNNFFNHHSLANSPAGNIAISLESVNPNAADTLEIDNNFISHFDKGIIAANQQRLCIRGNQIAIDYSTIPDRTWAGIKVYRGIGDTIFNNTITRAWAPLNVFEKRLFGISMESGEDNVVNNNTLINLGTGIRFFNSAIQNIVTCNSLSQNLNQITLEVAHIGDQGDASRASDNFWTRLDNGQQQTLANILIIDSVFLPPLPVWWVQNLPGFHPDINGLNCPGYICPFPSPISISSAPSANSCSYGCNDPDCIQALVADLISSLLGSTDPDNMTEYLKRKYAFDLIKQDTLLMHLGNANDIKLQDFYAEMSLSNSFYLNAILDLLSRNDTLYASIINSFITPENLFESNIIMLNEIYLATWAQGNFYIDSISRAKLEFIALQNPISGGEAVYGARIMLGLDIADYYFEFNSQKQRKETITTANTLGRIIPNPNSGEMQFVYRLKEEDNALLEIFDIKGVLLQSFKLDPFVQSIPIHMEDLPCGIYPYRLIINDTKISSDKILIKK